MMIFLKSIPDGPYFDLRFLTSIDVPFVILGIICLFIAYYKLKKQKPNHFTNSSSPETEECILENYDILMQRKNTKYDNSIPFVNFTMRNVYIGLAVILFILLLF